jgi:hypothetical protein
MLKRFLLYASKHCGLFALARLVTRGGLRILCYHGIALDDEAAFRPKLFIRQETLMKRLRYLRSRSYPVLPLQEACRALENDSLPPNAVVVTVDDGFYSAYQHAGLFGLPITVYVSSYYVVKRSPIFRLIVQYAFWKTERRHADLSGLGLDLGESTPLGESRETERIMWRIVEDGETQRREPERQELARKLAERLGVDYDLLVDDRRFSLMSAEEIRDLAEWGVDIQLHSHRHRFPENQAEALQELNENRSVLEPLVGRKLDDFCYPSGLWSSNHWPWLAQMGIRSAVTCNPGLNYPSTSRWALSRFLDGENISQIEFESELSGFSELLRRCRTQTQRVWNSLRPTPAYGSSGSS